jgi:hypothetical protein
VPKLLDFGIARLRDPAGGDAVPTVTRGAGDDARVCIARAGPRRAAHGRDRRVLAWRPALRAADRASSPTASRAKAPHPCWRPSATRRPRSRATPSRAGRNATDGGRTVTIDPEGGRPRPRALPPSA